jgi:hypothetical protein
MYREPSFHEQRNHSLLAIDRSLSLSKAASSFFPLLLDRSSHGVDRLNASRVRLGLPGTAERAPHTKRGDIHWLRSGEAVNKSESLLDSILSDRIQ